MINWLCVANVPAGENADGFGMVHGGNRFGERNMEGEMMLKSVAFPFKVGIHQGSVQSPLLFIILLEALSTGFR